MTSIPSAGGATVNRRLVPGLVVGLVAEVALLVALAFAAWGDLDGESMDPLSLEGGLGAMALFGVPGSVLVIGAALSLAAPKRWLGTIGASVLLFMAGVVGFVGFALTSLSRVEMSDC